jgi:hypothetical protein
MWMSVSLWVLRLERERERERERVKSQHFETA